MNQPLVSVVMTTYNRPTQLYGTIASIAAQGWRPDMEVIVVDDGDDDTHVNGIGVRYVRLNRPHTGTYLNSGPVANVGLRMARGEWVILQNAECMHMTNVIDGLMARAHPAKAIFARVVSLDEQGREGIEYSGPANPRPYFFCGLMARHLFMDLGGFDEDFTRYGYEDDDFADRLRRVGVSFEFTDLLVHHQWHEGAGTVTDDMEAMRALYERKRNKGVVRNVDRAWGKI